MKSIVAVDLDNVIVKTDRKIRQIIHSISGIPLSQDDIQSWDYAEALIARRMDRLSAKEVIARAFERFHERDCLGVEPLEGAVESILKFPNAGLDVVIVTARPRGKICEQLTKRWLTSYSIPSAWLVMEEDKSSLSASWSMLIDDGPHHARAVADLGTPVLLFAYPWNMNIGNHPLITRVRNWQEISARVYGQLT